MSGAVLDLLPALAGCALVLGVPGPTNALLAAAGAAGRRDGGALVGAVVAGYAVSVTTLRLAGAPLLASLPDLAAAVRLVLAGWLLYLGCCLWRRPPAGSGATIGPRAVFVATLLNPKGAVFAFALWPSRPAAASGDVAELVAWSLGLGAVVVAVSLSWFECGRRIAELGPRCERLVVRLGALLLFGFAAVLGATAIAMRA